MSQYTFSALTVDGERTYPLQFKWEDPQCPPNVNAEKVYRDTLFS